MSEIAIVRQDGPRHGRYEAPGSPKLARRGRNLVQEAGLGARLDPAYGFDHGTFSVFGELPESTPEREITTVASA